MTNSVCSQHPVFGAVLKASRVPAEPFTLRQVTLRDSPFKEARYRNARYLLSLEPDRLLHNTRLYAGRPPKAPRYGGWEARGIAGHTLGHYLTAISQQFAATGEGLFAERIAYLIEEMAVCQKAYGDGYIGALPPRELETLRGLKAGRVEIEGGFTFQGGAWVPWYTQHKVLAGLKDAWTLAGNAQAEEVARRLADWVDDVTCPLTPEQQQAMLQVEHGGMCETLADLYALTGSRKYLEAAYRFSHRAILDPLRDGHDELTGKHANTQIPKVIGQARLYEVAADADGRKIAEFFWDRVVNHRSWAIGGDSDAEHFFPEGCEEEHLGPAAAETCNTYNMLKLTRHLFAWQPRAEYFDFYERALYNHILASQEPKRGMFTYFMSLRPGHFKTYSTETDSFWCCVGSGMENHTKYNDSIYFHGAGDLYVNLFIPSRLDWTQKGLAVEMETHYPDSDQVEMRFTAQQPVALGVKVRCPQWAIGGLTVRLNGGIVPVASEPGTYTEVRRTWSTGDRLQVGIPMTVRSEPLPGTGSKRAFLYGPVALAGDLGPTTQDETVPYAADQASNFNRPAAAVPVLVRAEDDPTGDIRRVSPEGLVFRTDTADGRSVTLRPFHELFYDHYAVYWDVFTPAQYAARSGQ